MGTRQNFAELENLSLQGRRLRNTKNGPIIFLIFFDVTLLFHSAFFALSDLV
jgi:hypothetical protein